MLEISDTQLYYMTSDNICNIGAYKKYGEQWLSDLYIRVNDNNEVEPISKYNVLGYLIFYLSCLLTKYNMWQTNADDVKDKKYNVTTQKVIINTLVDLLNSILEMQNKPKKNYLYDIIINNFYMKLYSVYKNNTIIDKLTQMEHERTKTKTASVKTIDLAPISLTSKYVHKDYLSTSKWNKCIPYPYVIAPPSYKKQYIISINYITNCSDGKFHRWKAAGKDFKCSRCSIFMKDLKQIPDDTIQKNYIKTIKQTSHPTVSVIDTPPTSIYKDIIGELQKDTKDNITDFVKFLSSIIGDSINETNLFHDTYTITHNEIGHTTGKSHDILDKDSLVMNKNNHQYFGMDVIYVNYSKFEFYYDKHTLLYIGFREKGKTYEKTTYSGAFLIRRLSLVNILKSMGWNRLSYSFSQILENDTFTFNLYPDTKHAKNHIIHNLIDTHETNIKKLLSDIQVYVNKIKYGYIDDDTVFLRKYKSKFSDFKTQAGKFIFFDNWQMIKNNSHNKPTKYEYTDDIITYAKLNDFDRNSTNILHFIVGQLQNLFDINDNKNVRSNLAFFTVDMLKHIHAQFNEENENNDLELKRFSYILSDYDSLTELSDFRGDTDGLYEEYVDADDVESEEAKEQKDIDNEEDIALDMEGDVDYENGTGGDD